MEGHPWDRGSVRASVLVYAVGDLDSQQWCSQVILSEWESMLLSPCITTTPAIRAAVSMTPGADDSSGGGQRLTSTHRRVMLCS